MGQLLQTCNYKERVKERVTEYSQLIQYATSQTCPQHAPRRHQHVTNTPPTSPQQAPNMPPTRLCPTTLTVGDVILLRVQEPVVEGQVFVGQAAEVFTAVDVVGPDRHLKGQRLGVLAQLIARCLQDREGCCGRGGWGSGSKYRVVCGGSKRWGRWRRMCKCVEIVYRKL